MSSSVPAVDVRGLSKVYRLRHNARKATSFVEALSRTLRFGGQTSEAFWALKDVDFEVRPGRSDRHHRPQRRRQEHAAEDPVSASPSRPGRGRSARPRRQSLLEVGTGFHPELTGRENIFLNGAILGMRRSRDQPQVRRDRRVLGCRAVPRHAGQALFVSGMYVRLASPWRRISSRTMLIVDEVLAVGDAAFQRKCLGKMNEVVGQGRTVLFVSHNMSAITALTNRALVLEHGRIVFDGSTDGAIERYLGEGASEGQGYVAKARATEPAVTRLDIRTSQGGRVQAHGSPFEVTLEITTPRQVVGTRLHVTIVNRLGRLCSQAWLYDTDVPICRSAGVHRLVCRFPHLRLAPGQYTLRILFVEGFAGVRDLLERLCPFEVVMLGQTREGGWPVNDIAYFEDADWSADVVTDRIPG